MDDVAPRRIILLGKSGSGKSSLGNTVFGEELFPVDHGCSAETKKCETKTKLVGGCNVTLIDTPVFFGADVDSASDELKLELLKCIIECAPGPHAFLIVLPLKPIPEQEPDVVSDIASQFSDEMLNYSVVVFTHGDRLPEGKKIEDVVKDDKDVRDLVEKCGGRCHVVDNERWNEDSGDEYRTNAFQVKELLSTINRMVADNEGGVYTNEALEAVACEVMEEELESVLLSDDLSGIKKKGLKVLKIGVGVTAGVLLGAMFGVGKAITDGSVTDPAKLVVSVLKGGGCAGVIIYEKLQEKKLLGEALKEMTKEEWEVLKKKAKLQQE